MAYLIDTNIIIFAVKAPDRGVARKLASVQAKDISLSSVVEAELYHGAEKYGQPERRKAVVREFLDLYLRVPFDSRCVPHYAAIRHYLEKQGQLIGGNDLIIAADALPTTKANSPPQAARRCLGNRGQAGDERRVIFTIITAILNWQAARRCLGSRGPAGSNDEYFSRL